MAYELQDEIEGQPVKPIDRRQLERLMADYLKELGGVTGTMTLTVHVHQGAVGDRVGVGFTQTGTMQA